MKNHPLIQTLLNLKGNPRAVLYTEPLWQIPFGLYSPFISVYMAALLLTDQQIGIVASISALFQGLSALLSGAITDKLGRKWTTLIFDIISWSIPALLWALSQNFWWFAIAGALNGFMQVTANSWTCLFIEDAEKSSIAKLFTLAHLSAQLGIIFAPIAALMVSNLSIVPAMRIIFAFTCLSMTSKFILLFIYCEETKTGKVRLAETKDQSLFKIMSGYGGILRRILASKSMVLTLAIVTLFAAANMIMFNFFGLYAMLLVPTHMLAFFPIARSLIITLFMFGLQNFMDRLGISRPMLMGIALYAAGHAALILPLGYLSLAFYIFLEACAYSLVMPRRDSLFTVLVDPDERARINGVLFALSFGITIPFGVFAGFLSNIDRRLPFLANIGIFVLAFCVIVRNRKFLTEKMR